MRRCAESFPRSYCIISPHFRLGGDPGLVITFRMLQMATASRSAEEGKCIMRNASSLPVEALLTVSMRFL